MITRAALLVMITAFLDERKRSDGGYAPVDPKEVEQLEAIVGGLVSLKYGADADGDHPVEVSIVDRTRFERSHYFAIPYTHKAEKGREVEVLDEAIDLAATNVNIAAGKLDILIQCRRHQVHQQKKRSP